MCLTGRASALLIQMGKAVTVAYPTRNCVHLLRRKIPHTYMAEADSSDPRVEEQEMLKILKLA